MATHESHLFEHCPTCDGSGLVPMDDKAHACLRAGLRAGTCGDWVECWHCHRGKIEMVERIDTPTAVSVVVNGNRRN